MSASIVHGKDFEGSHLAVQGTREDGRTVAVPTYRHEVSLDYTRVEVELAYTFADRWDAGLRAPYDVKDQTATAAAIGEATPEERDAMRRNVDLHHRDATLDGFADLMLLATHRRDDLLRPGDALTISFGTTLPTGKTEEDPYRAAAEGRRHLHLQFGTGTFDPLLEASYRTPLTRGLGLVAYGSGRFPYGEGRKEYQGPVEATTSVALGAAMGERWYLHVDVAAFYQGFARWNGERDPNSGLLATSAVAGLGLEATKGAWLSLDFRYPVSQRTLDEGDAFEQGPTVSLRLSAFVRRRVVPF